MGIDVIHTLQRGRFGNLIQYNCLTTVHNRVGTQYTTGGNTATQQGGNTVHNKAGTQLQNRVGTLTT